MIRKAVETARKRAEFVRGRMIVQVRPAAVRPALARGPVEFRAETAKLLPGAVTQPLDYLRKNYGLSEVSALFSSLGPRLSRSSVSKPNRQRLAVVSSVAGSPTEGLQGFSVLSVDPKASTRRIVKTLKASPAMRIVEPMPARWLAARGVDPQRNLQWGLRAIRWFQADRPSARRIKVGLMDTGVDRTHPDLHGVVREYHRRGLSARDFIGHGTHVAGIVAAIANNRIGITGVANCPIVMWKIFDDEPDEDGEFYVDGQRFLEGLGQIAEQGTVNVLNLSIAGPARSEAEALLFKLLADSGVVVVAAMGNEFPHDNRKMYPAAYDGVVAVGALALNRRRSSFSNTGPHIDLMAPGSNILSTTPRSRSAYLPEDETDYAAWDGTSMAAPHVAAAAALVISSNPAGTPAQIRQHLKRTTTKLPNMRGRSWTRSYGAGLLNLDKALR